MAARKPLHLRPVARPLRISGGTTLAPDTEFCPEIPEPENPNLSSPPPPARHRQIRRRKPIFRPPPYRRRMHGPRGYKLISDSDLSPEHPSSGAPPPSQRSDLLRSTAAVLELSNLVRVEPPQSPPATSDPYWTQTRRRKLPPYCYRRLPPYFYMTDPKISRGRNPGE